MVTSALQSGPLVRQLPDYGRSLDGGISRANIRSRNPDEAFPATEYITIRNVPVFSEHKMQIGPGRELNFNARNLSLVCDSCNRRIRKTGDFAAVIVGHTPEAGDVDQSQREYVGAMGPYRMGILENDEGQPKPAILADFHILRAKIGVWRAHPRRSVELCMAKRIEDMFLDPVALLTESPQLDLGLAPDPSISQYSATSGETQLLYSIRGIGKRSREIVKYAFACPGATSVTIPASTNGKPKTKPKTGNHQPHIAYERGESTMAEGLLSDDAVKQIVEAIGQTDWAQWCQAKMKEDGGEGGGDEPGGDEPAAIGDEPSPSGNEPSPAGDPNPSPSGGEPSPGEPAKPEAGGKRLEVHNHYSRRSNEHRGERRHGERSLIDSRSDPRPEPNKYSRRSVARDPDNGEAVHLRREVEKLSKRLADQEGQTINAERRTKLGELRVIRAFDLDKEVERCKYHRMDAKAFADHCEAIDTNYRPIPIDEQVPVFSREAISAAAGAPGKPGVDKTKYHREAIVRARKVCDERIRKGEKRVSFDEVLAAELAKTPG